MLWALILWNSLLKDVVYTETLFVFKGRFDRHLKESSFGSYEMNKQSDTQEISWA